MVGRGFASIFWGMVADRIGRKPVIVFSLFTVIVFNTLFGLSVKYWMAITTRLLLGALNGFLAPIKAYSIEVCRDDEQALGISIVNTAWGLGLIIGPAIGGYLAQVPISSSMSLHINFRNLRPHKLHMASGVSLLVYQIFVYRWLNNTLGPVNSTRIASALSIPIIAAYPFMTHLSGIRLGLALYIAAMIKSVLAITRVSGTSLLQNNAVPQGQRGAANGIATTLMSLFKSVAPAGAGVLFSWAQKRQHAAFFPGDQMVFLLLNVTEVLGLLLTFKPFLAVPQHYK
uniref:Major facilitator superfamily (MFS) profile domain-containing protein n=1 Tax=Aegilops tauschii subsp. strangulata TaxID=200361 RepID=A0A453KCE2_AEGTS